MQERERINSRPADKVCAKVCVDRLRVASLWKLELWNVRTLRGDGKTEMLARALARQGVDVCGLCETRWQEESEMVVDDPDGDQKYKLWIGAGLTGIGGVGVAVRESVARCLEKWKAVSSRVGVLRLRGTPVGVSVVVAYAPVEDAEDAKKDEFYSEISVVVAGERESGRAVVTIGDFNARVGPAVDGEKGVVGKWALGIRNDNGRRLVNLAWETGLSIASSMFRKKCRRVTWLPLGKTRKDAVQLDHVLVQSRWRTAVRDVESRWGAEVDSDHALVVAKVGLRLRAGGCGKKVKQVPWEEGANLTECGFEVEIRNRFAPLAELGASEVNECSGKQERQQ